MSGININSQGAKVWRKDIEGQNGTFYRYSIGLSRKREDGSYENMYLPVKFAKASGVPEKIENGAVCDIEGFLTFESYTNKDGNQVKTPSIVVMSADFEDTGFTEVDEVVPF